MARVEERHGEKGRLSPEPTASAEGSLMTSIQTVFTEKLN